MILRIKIVHKDFTIKREIDYKDGTLESLVDKARNLEEYFNGVIDLKEYLKPGSKKAKRP